MSGYGQIHFMARKALGDSCERCDATERLQAALRLDAAPEQLRTDPASGCAYSINVRDYWTLCQPCHRRLDLVEARPTCTRGHEYTPDNTYVRSDGTRRCRRCQREGEAARLADPAKRETKRERDRERRALTPLTAEQKARKLELQRRRRAAARSARFEHEDRSPW
jgi:hypothetical protein